MHLINWWSTTVNTFFNIMFLHLSLFHSDGGDGQESRKRARSPAEDAEPSGHLHRVCFWLTGQTHLHQWSTGGHLVSLWQHSSRSSLQMQMLVPSASTLPSHYESNVMVCWKRRLPVKCSVGVRLDTPVMLLQIPARLLESPPCSWDCAERDQTFWQ